MKANRIVLKEEVGSYLPAQMDPPKMYQVKTKVYSLRICFVS